MYTVYDMQNSCKSYLIGVEIRGNFSVLQTFHALINWNPLFFPNGYLDQYFVNSLLYRVRKTILSVLAVHRPFYISICISTLRLF